MTAKTKYALVVLAEELGEMQKEVLKALRFGLNATNPKTGVTNYQAMREEFNDIVGSMEFFAKSAIDDVNTPNGAKNNFVGMIDWNKVYEKVDKIEHYFKYSEQRGQI